MTTAYEGIKFRHLLRVELLGRVCVGVCDRMAVKSPAGSDFHKLMRATRRRSSPHAQPKVLRGVRSQLRTGRGKRVRATLWKALAIGQIPEVQV